VKLLPRDIVNHMKLYRLRRQARKHPSPGVWALLIERYLSTGDAPQALAIAEEGLSDFPTNDRLQALRRLIQKEKIRERVKELRQSIRRRPDPYLYARLADVFRQLGELNKAESIADECKVRFPTDENPYLVIGEIRADRYKKQLMARDGQLAIENLERAVSLNPENFKGRMQLAEIYAALGANSRALPHLLHLAEATPEDERIRNLISEVGSRPVEEGDLTGLLRSTERKRETPYPFYDGERRQGRNAEANEPETDRALVHRATMPLLGIREIRGLYVAADDLGMIEVREDPELCANGFLGVAMKILKAAETSSRKMDMGGFAKGSLEGSFGRIVLRRTKRLEVALLLDRGASVDAVSREVDAFFDKIYGSNRIAGRAGRS